MMATEATAVAEVLGGAVRVPRRVFVKWRFCVRIRINVSGEMACDSRAGQRDWRTAGAEIKMLSKLSRDEYLAACNELLSCGRSFICGCVHEDEDGACGGVAAG